MFSQTAKILIALLIAQIGLVASLSSSSNQFEPFESAEKLVTLSLSELDSIFVEEKDKKAIELRKAEGKWILPELDNFPVSPEKLEKLQTGLFDQSQGWPVGTTLIAAKQFKVSDDEFVKKLKLMKGGVKAGTVYIGNSPGFKKLYVRTEGSDNTHAIEFGAHEVSTQTKDWIDRAILKLDKTKFTELKIGEKRIRPDGGQFKVVSDNDELVKNELANSVVTAFGNMGIVEYLGTEDKAEYNLDKPALIVQIERSEGEPLQYRFAKKTDDEGNYILKRSDLPFFFKVLTSAVDNAIKVRETEIKPKEEVAPQAANSEEPESGENSSSEETPATE